MLTKVYSMPSKNLTKIKIGIILFDNMELIMFMKFFSEEELFRT